MKFTAINNTLLPTSSEAEQFIKDNQGRDCYLTIEEQTRTLRQNKYLHKVFSILGDEIGYSTEDMKELLLRELNFIRVVKNNKTGADMIVRKSTKDLNTKEFSELTERILQWAAEHGFSILSPAEYIGNE